METNSGREEEGDDVVESINLKLDYLQNPEKYREQLKELNERVLRDDWRILCAWYQRVKEEKPFKYTKDEIVKIASFVYKEIMRRVREGEMKFTITSELSEELEAEILKRRETRKFVSGEKKYLPISPGTVSEKGEVIKLEEFLGKLKSFEIRNPFITIVGSIANHGETKGDIDILINASKDEEIFHITSWRLNRAFPEYAGRIHCLSTDDYHGPFTCYVPVYNLKVERIEEVRRVEMSEIKIEYFEPFKQQKPQHGRDIGEPYTIDKLVEVVNRTWEGWQMVGVYVSKKCDGVTCQVHKKGETVRIWTEAGEELTKNLPTLCKELQEYKDDFIFIGELELWENGEHQNRAETAGVVNHGGEREKNIRLTIYDLFRLDEVDYAGKPYGERRKRYENIAKSERIKVYPEDLCRNEKELRKAVEKYREMEGSEGAMIKLANAPYIFKERVSPPSMIKFKNEYQLVCKVIGKEKVEGAEAWVYIVAIENNTYCGKTFNTSLNVDVGDKIIVSFVDISKYITKAGEVWFKMWSPHVIGKTGEKISTIEEATGIVKKTTGRIEEKEMEGYSEGRKYVVQAHWRGGSVHFDFRYENDRGSLDGFTMLVQEPKEVKTKWRFEKDGLYWGDKIYYEIKEKEVIDKSTEELKEEIRKWYEKETEREENFKIDVKTGKQIGKQKIECVEKAVEPKAWMDMEGLTDPRIVEPEPGGTRFYPGCFVEIDRGVLDVGAQKEYFREFFLKGKWEGRVVFRMLKMNGRFTWLYWKTDDQTPYVLSKRAVEEEWLPDGYSALPSEMEYKVPANLNYWDTKIKEDERLERRNEVREFFKKEGILKENGFRLAKRWWRGQLVIRGLPVVDYFLEFGDGKYCFHIRKDMRKTKTVGTRVNYKEEMFTPGMKKPSTWINPNKRIPAYIEIVESGTVEILEIEKEEGEEVKRIVARFKGEKMKGVWEFKRERNGPIYTITNIS